MDADEVLETPAGDALARSAGAQLADRIAADVVASNFAPGVVLASEQELRSTHEAGRSVFRQAVRILEARGVAYMRRGQGGGLVVADPNPEFAARSLAIVAESLSQNQHDLAPVTHALEAHVFIEGASRLAPERAEEIRALARRLDRLPPDRFLSTRAHRQLHRAVSTATGEATVQLVFTAATEFGLDLTPYAINVAAEGSKGEAWRITCDTAEALAAGDVRAVLRHRQRLASMFPAEPDAWSALERDPRRLPKVDDASRPEFEEPSNRAERLTREILREIRLLGWREGERIGGFADLAERYAASGATVRQAVRVLEQHAAVRSVRGRKGGLFIARPQREHAIALADLYLRRSGASPQEARAMLLQFALHALDGPEPPRAGQLAAGLAPANLAELCMAVVRAGGNPVLELFAEALLPLARERAPALAAADLARFPDADQVARRRALLALATRG
jgi:DNA-binding FadR family transcriptional regulator